MFRFDPGPHTYTLGGSLLPSVTQILAAEGILPDYEWLDEFYRERGSAVHRAIELELLGKLDWDSLDEHVRPRVENFRRFAELYEIEPRVIEFSWYSREFGYAGMCDLVADSNVGLMIPDWKSGGIEPGHKVQVAGGYVPLLEQAAKDGVIPVSFEDIRSARVGIVSLATEIPKPVWLSEEEKAQARDVFRSALACHNWKRQHLRRKAA